MICFGDVPSGSVLPIIFGSYNSSGASVTLSGLAVTDIEIFKGTSMTQRSSDAGYALLDTDGIDIDSLTGINGFSIDTGDNTDSGFYAVGSFYTVVVSAVTIDSQTVNFVAATFRIREAETTAGRIEARIGSIANNAITAASLAADAGTEIASAGGIVFGVTDDDGSDDEFIDSARTEPSGAFINCTVVFLGGTNERFVRKVVAYDGAGTFQIDTAVAGDIDSGVNYILIPGDPDVLGPVSSLNNISATDVWDAAIDGSTTAAESMRLQNAALAGKASGMGTTTATFRDLADTKDRIVATVDADGNRTAVTRDAS